jgi:hypothetical protein
MDEQLVYSLICQLKWTIKVKSRHYINCKKKEIIPAKCHCIMAFPDPWPMMIIIMVMRSNEIEQEKNEVSNIIIVTVNNDK